MKSNKYDGLWKVTTEGDVEGRTINDLGTYFGNISEIALHLADKAYYGLNFRKVEPIDKYIPSKNAVHVSISGVKVDEDFNMLKESFKGYPVVIEKSNYYNSFV